MYQTEVNLHQQKEYVLSKLAEKFGQFSMEIEDLHEHQVTCILHSDEYTNSCYEYLNQQEVVSELKILDDETILVTKPSCGAYSAVYGNNCILQRESKVEPSNRRYHVLAFSREDIRSMIKDFRDIGTVTLHSLTEYGEQEEVLTDRQQQVIETALEEGYFKWPRKIDSEELADQIGINRSTCLEHLRKAEAKLVREALGQRVKR